jgi:hypothetical protein
MFATGCRWPVLDPDAFIPGTSIVWNDLIAKSLIFPYHETHYLFPYNLVWSNPDYEPDRRYHIEELRNAVKVVYKSLVNNLEMEHLFPKYSDIGVSDIHPQGMIFERLIASSFAVKYYLCKLTTGENDVSFRSLYRSEFAEWSTILDVRTFDFSQGLNLPLTGEVVGSKTLAHAVTWNVELRNAHHDLILYSKQGSIPVQLKYSFDTPTTYQLDDQLKVHRNGQETVDKLIWVSLADLPEIRRKLPQYLDRVVFLNGSGVCNGMSWDMLCSFKRVKKIDSASH